MMALHFRVGDPSPTWLKLCKKARQNGALIRFSDSAGFLNPVKKWESKIGDLTIKNWYLTIKHGGIMRISWFFGGVRQVGEMGISRGKWCCGQKWVMEIGWFTTHKCGTLATEKSGCVIKLECLKTTDPQWVCLSYSKGASHIRMGFFIKTTLCRGQPDKWDSPYNPRKCSRKSPCWCTAGSCFWGKPGDILQLLWHQTKGALRCKSKIGIGKSL